MKNKFLLLLGLLCYFNLVFSQNDTISCHFYNIYRTRFSPFTEKIWFDKYIASISLITIGSSVFVFEEIKNLNYKIEEKTSSLFSHSIIIDDYIQYLSVTGVYGLSVMIKPKHNLLDRTLLLTSSYVSMAIMVNGLKWKIHSQRPDNTSDNSFPSGHTATAFMGAHLIFQEYKDNSLWYGIGGYVLASSVGLLRIYNKRHWPTDVIAGAGFGILSTEIGYLMLPKIKCIFHLE